MIWLAVGLAFVSIVCLVISAGILGRREERKKAFEFQESVRTITDEPSGRWQVLKWKYAPDTAVDDVLAALEGDVQHLEPLFAVLDQPEWWEINERIASD